jgi:hypothetical protein
MSVNWTIPKSSVFISTKNIVIANFNIPVVGKYSFDVPANRNIPIVEMKKNSVYLIERLSIGGNVGEEEYFSALENAPELIIKKSISNERVYPRPLPVLNYADGAEVVAWVASNKKDDILVFDCVGLLRQTAVLNGVPSISLSVSFGLYEISNTEFYKRFTGREGVAVGRQVGGGSLPTCNLCG